jgi:hypothetical protein
MRSKQGVAARARSSTSPTADRPCRYRIPPSFDNLALRALPVEDGPRTRPRPVAGACFSRAEVQPLDNPSVVAVSEEALQLLGLDPREVGGQQGRGQSRAASALCDGGACSPHRGGGALKQSTTHTHLPQTLHTGSTAPRPRHRRALSSLQPTLGATWRCPERSLQPTATAATSLDPLPASSG